MRIHILCRDGSPLGCSVKTLMGDDIKQIGVGGAELALLTQCEIWQKHGDEVVLFNDPRELNASPFEQRSIASFDKNEKCDVLIVFRSTNPLAIGAKADLKLFWSMDQQTTGNFAEFRQYVDKVVGISPRHKEFFEKVYNINDMIVIDLPVRVWEYENKNIEKVKNRFIFTSVPARGLDIMLELWPHILKEVPDATLIITSDYRLWNCGRGNEAFIALAMQLDGIVYLSAVKRPRLIEEQLKAEIHSYSSFYDELFCIAVAESEVAGVYPITTDFGSLPTTNMGKIIKGDPRNNNVKNDFIDACISACNNREQTKLNALDIQKKAMDRFHPDIILKQWDERVFKNG